MIGVIETPVSAIVTNVHLMEMIKAAGAAGEPIPSAANLALLNTFFNSLQSAITGGAAFRDVYSLILIYGTDLVYTSDLGFDARHGNDPYKKAFKSPSGTLTKTAKSGYGTDGVAYINCNYKQSEDTKSTATDRFHLGIFRSWTNNGSGQTHASGSHNMRFSGSNANYGWVLHRGINLASAKSGFLDYYAETDASQSHFYYQNVLQSSTNTGVDLTSSGLDLLSLCRTNNLNVPVDFLHANTRESLRVVGKRTNINRTTLYNAAIAYANGVFAL
jgi:hypothetical protein